MKAEERAGITLARIPGWLLSPSGLRTAAAWGFAEATLFFIMPDIILTATALFSVRQSLRQMAAAVVGALAGGALMYGMAVHDPASAKTLVQGVPFVRHRMFETVERDFQTAGIWAPCKGPTSGVPYKVYAVEAPRYTGWFSFLLLSIPARLERLVVTWAIFASLGAFLRRNIQSHPLGAMGFHALYWIAIYTYYWSVI